MATQTTLLDIAKRFGTAGDVGLIEEAIPRSAEARFIPARYMPGFQYKTLVRTSYPTAAFRSANEGVTASKSTWENRQYECAILSSNIVCDVALANAYEDGAPVYLANEAAGAVEGALAKMATQLYYGSAVDGDGNPVAGGDAKGFAGLLQQYDTAMCVDAGGSTANTGSSVWAMRLGHNQCQFIYGGRQEKAGPPITITQPVQQLVTAANGLQLAAYVMSLNAWCGFQVGSKYAVARLKNLTAETGCGLTDAKLSSLMSLFPDVMPDVIFASRRSIAQLQKSRTATSVDGKPAPVPTDFWGIPLLPTDSIRDTESLTL